MKKILIFTDAHGNYEAIKIIDNLIKELQIDYIISAGDLIGIGPSHNEVLEIVTKWDNFYTVKGNHERYYTDGFHNPLAALEGKFHDWVRNTMDEKFDSFIRNLEYEKELFIEGQKIIITHYARTNTKFTTIENNRTTENMLNLFSYLDADIIIFGHDHSGYIYKGNKTLINIGTLGCTNLNVGKAKFGILTIDHNNIDIQEYLIDYDITPEIKKMDELNVPDKELIKRIFFKK